MYLENYIKGEIEFNIENIINDISNYQEDIEKTQKIENLTDYDIQEICDSLLNNDYFMQTLNQFVNENIESEIYHYINK
jgi:DNA-binding ferritin-like protein (Dps family)